MKLKTTKFKQELGKACSVAAVGIVVAVFVTTKLTGRQLESSEVFTCLSLGFLLMSTGALLLIEKEKKPRPGKWKGMKVKKDTTIHFLIEEEG